MGRVFLQEFEKIEGNYFYVCCVCETHILLLEHLRQYLLENGQVTGHIFSYAFSVKTVFQVSCNPGYNSVSADINVHTYSPVEDRRVNNRTIADIYCNKCCNLLGFKFIEIAANDGKMRVGDLLIDLDKLKIWEDYEVQDTQN